MSANEVILRSLVDARDRNFQKVRIAMSNRLSAIERGSDIPPNGSMQLLEKWLERARLDEEEATKDIEEIADEIPIVQEMIKVKGVGKILAAKVACLIDIRKAQTVSALWKFAGYGLDEYWCENGKIVAPKQGWKWVQEGKDKKKVFAIAEPKSGWVLETRRDRMIEGWCAPSSRRLKTNCHLVGESFLKARSPYRQIYDEARDHYLDRENWTDGHKHNAAMTKMIKIWLQHLWLVWRRLEGLPISQPYAHGVLGHGHLYTPWDFGWDELAVPFE